MWHDAHGANDLSERPVGEERLFTVAERPGNDKLESGRGPWIAVQQTPQPGEDAVEGRPAPTEPPRVDEGVPARVQQPPPAAVDGRLGVKAVGDRADRPAQAGLQVGRDRLGHGDDPVGPGQQGSLEGRVEALHQPQRELPVGLEAPAVPQVGDPRNAATPKDAPHHVHRLGWRRRQDAVCALAANQSEGGAQREWEPAHRHDVRHRDTRNAARLHPAQLAGASRPPVEAAAE
jgi:hypothetical protein